MSFNYFCFSFLLLGDDGLYECEMCLRKYKTKTGIRQHMKYECGKEPQFPCPRCSYKAKYKGHLKRHMFSVHIQPGSGMAVNLSEFM